MSRLPTTAPPSAGYREYRFLQHHRWRRDVVGRFMDDRPGDGHCRFARRQEVRTESVGTFPTTGGLLIGLVVGIIVIIGGLTFFPASRSGPRRSHLDDPGADIRRHHVRLELSSE